MRESRASLHIPFHGRRGASNSSQGQADALRSSAERTGHLVASVQRFAFSLVKVGEVCLLGPALSSTAPFGGTLGSAVHDRSAPPVKMHRDDEARGPLVNVRPMLLFGHCVSAVRRVPACGSV